MENNILGCFVSSTVDDNDGPLFRTYIYGKNKTLDTLSILEHQNYGKDIVLILFQFYVKPIPYLLQNLKEIENYRRNEKSIGIPIIVTDENFFSKNEPERYDFLRDSILQKMDLLDQVVKKKKLDTNMELLKSDVKKILIQYL